MGLFDFLKQKKDNSKEIIEYIPDTGLLINTKEIRWNSDRSVNRIKLNLKFKDDDQIFDVSEFFDGDNSKNIEQKRDVYENCFSNNDLFFLHYDENNKLKEIEVHFGYEIKINEFKLEFGKSIKDYLNAFKKKGIEYSEIENGNYFVEKLKITIADSNAMGGKGNEFSYFYGTSEVSHLIE